MITLKLVFLFCAGISFALKAFGVNTGRIDCFALGWMFIVAAILTGLPLV